MMSRFDQFAAKIGRTRYAPVKGRYNIPAQQQNKRLEDTTQLAREISQVVNKKSLNELYNYIYRSDQLDWLVESRGYGFSSLRAHLLNGVNLIVHSYQKGYLNHFLEEVYSSSEEAVVA
jgi:hypothetical protein